jgi:hypothetical protein
MRCRSAIGTSGGHGNRYNKTIGLNAAGLAKGKHLAIIDFRHPLAPFATPRAMPSRRAAIAAA